jgi:hypothetical protein
MGGYGAHSVVGLEYGHLRIFYDENTGTARDGRKAVVTLSFAENLLFRKLSDGSGCWKTH